MWRVMSMNKYSKKRLSPSTAVRYFIMDDSTPFAVREAYKSIRTNLLSVMAVRPGTKQVCITSPEMGDGKTQTCANIAVAFAQTGARVLIIDADMRKPKIHKVFKIPSAPGLSSCLGGFSTLDEAIVHCQQVSGLDVLPAGKIPPNPTELILSANFDNLLSVLAEKYDYIFLDAPPVCLVTDAVIISKKTMGAVLVCRAGVTKRDIARRAFDEVARGGGQVIGTLLNGVDVGRYSNYDRMGAQYGYYQSSKADEAEQEDV